MNRGDFMWNRVELKKTARERLKSYQGKAILVCLIIIVLESLPVIFNNEKVLRLLNKMVSVDSNLTEDGLRNYFMYCTDIFTPNGPVETILSDIPLFGWVLAYVIFRLVLTYLILHPLKVGQNAFYYKNRLEETSIDELVYAFDARHYKNIVKTEFITYMHIWFYTLLFIIPGIMYSFVYYLVPYILVEDPMISTKEAMELSKKMTDGHKKEMFVYAFSFIGWDILGMLTFGLSDIFYGVPYRQAADAELYFELKHFYNSKLIGTAECE